MIEVSWKKVETAQYAIHDITGEWDGCLSNMSARGVLAHWKEKTMRCEEVNARLVLYTETCALERWVTKLEAALYLAAQWEHAQLEIIERMSRRQKEHLVRQLLDEIPF
jgi:uncharacterized protein YhdP